MAIAGAYSAATYFAVRQRAIAFAERHSTDSLCRVLKLRSANPDEVVRFGTPGSNEYAEVVVRTEYKPAFIEARLREATDLPSNRDREELERFIVGFYLDVRIVSTSTDVLHHDCLNADLCCGELTKVRLLTPPTMGLASGGGAAICERALAFAGTDQRYVDLKILQRRLADSAEVQEFGTPGSAEYGEVIIGRKYSAAHYDSMLAWESRQRNPELERMQDFLAHPLALRVVCTATDVIQHEDVQLLDGEEPTDNYTAESDRLKSV